MPLLPRVRLALLLGIGSTVGGAVGSTVGLGSKVGGAVVGGAVVGGAEGVEWNYQSLEDSGKFCPERDSCRSDSGLIPAADMTPAAELSPCRFDSSYTRLRHSIAEKNRWLYLCILVCLPRALEKRYFASFLVLLYFLRNLCFVSVYRLPAVGCRLLVFVVRGSFVRSVAAPGCLSGTFSILDPGSKRFRIPDPDPHQRI
jgi:hypothetical protein